jgi:uncharacterized protein YgbK (DUF1537 family)
MPILYTFYGDDFTGSTDVLEQLASNGVRTALFFAPPTPDQLANFPHLEAIGIAGDSRSRSPQWMSANLPGIFAALRQFHAPIVHYKVCSTFDSSPTHGSIGRAIELGIEAFNPVFVPIVVGTPHLRRYVYEGRLFAADASGNIHRIDRHPMRNHPVTPMREPDLRRHLALQTDLPIGHIPHDSINAQTLHDNQEKILLFDTTSAEDLAQTGELIWQQALQHPLFFASSSGLTAALITAWRTRNMLPPKPIALPITPANPLLVVSGSCSPVTARQIRHALAHGFHGIQLTPETILSPATIAAATASLAASRDTILYTALGPPSTPAHGETLGAALGQLIRQILTRIPLRRILLCGGDTSSHAIPQLGLTALTWLANLQPGAPLCQAYPGGLQLVLKGGQVGTEDFFQLVRAGSGKPSA